MRGRPTGPVLGVVGGVVAIASIFLPWWTAGGEELFGVVVPSIEVRGIHRPQGWAALAAGTAAVALGAAGGLRLRVVPHRVLAGVLTGAGAVVVGAAVAGVVSGSGRIAPGLVVGLAAGLLIIAAGLLWLRPPAPPPPAAWTP